MLKFLKFGILFVIAVSPWAFGAVKPWGYTLITLLGLVFLLLWSLRRVIIREPEPVFIPKLFYPFAAFVIFVALQLVPLPMGLVKLLSPARVAYWEKLNLSSTGLALPTHLTLSVDPYLTTLALVNLCSLLIYFFLLVQFLHTPSGPNGPDRPDRLDRPDRPDGLSSPHTFSLTEQTAFLKHLAFTIITIGFLIALFGIIQKFIGVTEIYGIMKVEHPGGIMGPFSNYDKFAGYLEMPMGLAIGILLFLRREAPYRWLLALAVVLMGAGIFYSASRGGVLSFFFQLICAGLLAFAFRPNRSAKTPADLRLNRPLLIIPALLVAVLAAVSYIGPDALLSRLNQDLTKEGRLLIWKDTLNMTKDFPVLGAGYGAFRTGYRVYQSGLDQEITAQAHNDYLEALSETGIVGAVLILIFLGLLIADVTRGSTSHFAQAVQLGAFLGILAILLHSFFDFNLQIFGNALLFITLIAIVNSGE